MIVINRAEKLYLDWLIEKIGNGHQECKYTKLLNNLYLWEFTWTIDHDEYRARRGLELKDEFVEDSGLYLEPCACSILEMMIGLACDIEDKIMTDADLGDRTHLWFWSMVNSLGLSCMSDDSYDSDTVDSLLISFLNREYCQDGLGGLFYIPGTEKDMRKTEIWYQMHAFLNVFCKDSF